MVVARAVHVPVALVAPVPPWVAVPWVAVLAVAADLVDLVVVAVREPGPAHRPVDLVAAVPVADPEGDPAAPSARPKPVAGTRLKSSSRRRPRRGCRATLRYLRAKSSWSVVRPPRISDPN